MQTIQWVWELVANTDSTNRMAVEYVRERWAADKSAEGVVIVAARQTAGRGQHGRIWESPPGGLYMSAVVENVPPDLREALALMAGLSVAEALPDVPLRVRWPNDLMLGDKKVAGILCEARAQGHRWAAVIGIGMNVTTKLEQFSPDLRQRATSLLAWDAQLREIDEVGQSILKKLDALLIRARTKGMEAILSRLRERDGLLGRRIRVETGGQIFEGEAAGFDERGRLRILDHGKVHTLSMGTIVAVDGRHIR